MHILKLQWRWSLVFADSSFLDSFHCYLWVCLIFGNIRMWFPSLPVYLIFPVPWYSSSHLCLQVLGCHLFVNYLLSFSCLLAGYSAGFLFFFFWFPSDSFLSILFLCLPLLRRSQCQNVSSVGLPITSSASPLAPPVFSSLGTVMAQTSFSNCHVNIFTSLKKIGKIQTPVE